MRKYAKDKRPQAKPLIKAELSERNKTLRIALIAILLVLGVGLLAFSLVNLLGRGQGYTEIEDENSPFSDFFVLNYDIGASGASASAEHRLVKQLYTSALDKYCRMFSADTEYEGVKNLHYINAHPGESIEIDPALYSALKKMENEGDRQHYLGLSLEIYSALFSSEGDGYAQEADPVKNSEIREINRQACGISLDDDEITIQFLGDNTIRLKVSEEYTAFAAKYGLSRYIDLGVFKNAFIVDNIAASLAAEGYTLGAISSYDGYSRNLDARDKTYKFSFYAKNGSVVYPVCDASYNGKLATCLIRTYPMTELDALDFYLYSSGESAHRLIDSRSGEYRSAMPELLLASDREDCASLAIRAYSALVGSRLDFAALEGVTAAWVDGFTVYYRGEDFALSDPYKKGETEFVISKRSK